MQTPAPVIPAKHDPYAALRIPSFFAYSFGWVSAVLGQQMANVALGWDVYQRTHSPLSLGWVGLTQAIPVILLALPAGQIADRFDRRRVVIITQILGAICAVILAWISYRQLPVAYIYGILVVGATAAAIGGPSRSALLPQIVPPAVFSNAVGWNSSFFQMSSVVGPAFGGFLLRYSPWLVYLCDAALALVFSVSLLGVKVRPIEGARKEPATLRTLTEGVRFVWNNQIILATITLDLFAVLLGGAVFLLPVFAERLGVGTTGFGWLRAAPALGAVVMALIVNHLPPMKNAGRAMLLAVAGFGAATIVFGLTPWYWLALVALFLTGAFDQISVVVRHTLVQVLAPDAMRGRVSAVNNVFIGASNELGGFESGLTARLFGPVWSVVGGGIGTIAVVIAAAITWPQLRKFGSLHDARPMEPEPPRGVEPVMKASD
jgi:MFS family permease